MKLTGVILILTALVLYAAPDPRLKDPFQITWGTGPLPTHHVIKPNQVVLIEAYNGAKALLEVNCRSASDTTYRWRYRAPNSNKITTGTNTLCWAVDRVKNPSGTYTEIRRPEHNTKILAGEMTITWYYGIPNQLYIHPSKAKVKIFDGVKEFDRDF